MRKQFVKTFEKIFSRNKRNILLLGDIGVYGFQKLIKKNPKQALNIGILEQSTISFAAGLSKMGFIPTIHTIAPFIVSRAFEQLKIDFGYQRLNGNFVTVGASYDYAGLGCTHHCPEDINLMKNIPDMEIIVPGHSEEFNRLFLRTFNNKSATYFRLSETENSKSEEVVFGKAKIIQYGSKATIIIIGPVLDLLSPFIKKYNVNVLYYTTIRPFDKKTLIKSSEKINKFLIIEPFYTGSINIEVSNCFKKNILIQNISVPFKFLTNYGKKIEHDKKIGLSSSYIEKKLIAILNKVI